MRDAAFAMLARAEAGHRRADWKAAARMLAALVEAMEQERASLEYVAQPAPVIAPEAVGTLPPAPVTTQPGGQAPRMIVERPERVPLIKWLADHGGVRDPGGELAHIDAQLWHRTQPFRRRLIRDDGMTLEHAAEAAWEHGLFGSDYRARGECPIDSEMLLSAVAAELRDDDRWAAMEPEEMQ